MSSIIEKARGKPTKVQIWHDPGQSHSANFTMIDAGERPLIVYDPAKGRLWVKGPHVDMEYFDVTCIAVGD